MTNIPRIITVSELKQQLSRFGDNDPVYVELPNGTYVWCVGVTWAREYDNPDVLPAIAIKLDPDNGECAVGNEGPYYTQGVTNGR